MTSLLRNYKQNTPVWHVILTQTSLLENSKVWSQIKKRLNKKELDNLINTINKFKLNQNLHEEL